MLSALFFILLFPRTASADDSKITEKDYDWWRKARFGIFIHWNHSSMLALGSGSWMREGKANPKHSSNKTDDKPFVFTKEIRDKYWSGRSAQVPQVIYDNMYKSFNPSEFNAKEWAKTFKAAGAGYIVFTTKHHDGFCMFNTKQTKYNIMNSKFGRDIAKELSDACAEVGIKVIWYYSVVDWYNTRFNVDNPKPYEDYLVAQIDELFGNYKNIAGVWWDGGGINVDSNRVWKTIKKHCAHPLAQGRGIRLPGMLFGTPEQRLGSFNMNGPWESCVTMQGEEWFWDGGKVIKPLSTCIRLLVNAAGGDGNLLLDIGPTEKGTIFSPVRENLLNMGKWLNRYGTTIRGTRGGPYKPGPWGVATRKGNKIYLHITQEWPSGILTLPPLPAKVTACRVLTGGEVDFKQDDKELTIKLDPKYHSDIDTIVELTLDSPAMKIAPIGYPERKLLSIDSKVTTSSEFLRGVRGMAGSVAGYKLEYNDKGHEIRAWSNLSEENKKKYPWLKLERCHIWRYWLAKGSDKQPWLQLDLPAKKTFSRIEILEKFDRVVSYEIQIPDGDGWKTIFKGKRIGNLSIDLPKPVTADKVRLVILKYETPFPYEGPGIRQFNLYKE
jgi:alpha-L-fucosidase